MRVETGLAKPFLCVFFDFGRGINRNRVSETRHAIAVTTVYANKLPSELSTFSDSCVWACLLFPLNAHNPSLNLRRAAAPFCVHAFHCSHRLMSLSNLLRNNSH